MLSFSVPTFGATNVQQTYGSPKPASLYQPMPAVGTPSFGMFGRPGTPKETSRHSSYSSKDVEPMAQPIIPSVERPRRHREYYLEGGDIYFLVRFRVPSLRFTNASSDPSLTGRKLLVPCAQVRKISIVSRPKKVWRTLKVNWKPQIFLRARICRIPETVCR